MSGGADGASVRTSRVLRGVISDPTLLENRFVVAASWEEESPRRLLWEQMAPAWNYLGAVRASVMAATSVDVKY